MAVMSSLIINLKRLKHFVPAESLARIYDFYAFREVII